jgi:SEC-C motif-containing protein
VDAIFHGTEYFFNWCQEFENELGNAGVHDPRYWRERVRYVNEFLAQFSDEDEQPLLGNFLRAEAETLWRLGEQSVAEDRYETLIARLPNFAWSYIGLADCYWLGPEPTPEPKQYAQAVSSRLSGGASKPKSKLRGIRGLNHPESAVTPSVMAGASHKLGRNEPCWCGSGVKSKRYHLDADRSLLRSP